MLRRSSIIGYALACGVLLGLGACSARPDRQNPLAVNGVGHAEFLPEAQSIHNRYKPSPPGTPPNAEVAYHVTPTLSYADRPLSDNLSAALELADYNEAVKQAGFGAFMEGEDSYTVLAFTNEAFEAYVHQWERDLFASDKHGHLAGMIGQTILKGRWSLAKIRRRAAMRGGCVYVPTLAGPGYDVSLKPTNDGKVQVIGRAGTVFLSGKDYPQANGVLFVTDAVLRHR